MNTKNGKNDSKMKRGLKMSHRNSHPKPSASERTHRRWRFRHNIETVLDEQHYRVLEEIKETARAFFAKLIKPKENDLIVAGSRVKK